MEKFNHYFLDTVKNRYADFNGRATRSEYWYFVLFFVLISIVLTLIDTTVINPLMLHMTPEEATQGGLLSFLFALAMLLPHIGVGIRRLHDIGKSGWWLLIGFVPVVGLLVLLYFFVQPSK